MDGRIRIPGGALLDLIFPPRCPFCGRILDTAGICGGCRASLPWTGEADGLRELPGGVPCAGPLRYEGPVREAVLRMKFQGRTAAIRPLGELIASCAAGRFPGAFDTVTWVPVGPRRRRRRGFDQSRLLAGDACRSWGVRPVGLLVKDRDRPAQSSLKDPAARRANARGAWSLRADPGGRRILLIDDVCTTGATLAECAEVLRRGGAAGVVCAVAALAGPSSR